MPYSDQVSFETFVADTPVIVYYAGKQILGVFTKEGNRPLHLQPEEITKLVGMIPKTN